MIYQFNFLQDWSGRGCLTAYHVYIGNTPEAEEVFNFAEAVIGAYDELLQPFLSNTWQLTGASSRRVDAAGYPTITIPGLTVPLVGSDTNQPVSRNNAFLVRFFSNTPKPNRGWRFIPGMSELHWQGTVWNSSLVAVGETFGEALITASEEMFSAESYLAVVSWNVGHTAVDAYNRAFAGDSPTWAASQRERRF